MPSVTIPVGRGNATGIDPSLVDDGQLQEAVGVVYDVSNPAAKKMGGRTVYNSTPTPGSLSIDHLSYFDAVSSAPFLVASTGNNVYTSPMDGSAPTIASGLSVSGSISDQVVFNDKLVLVGPQLSYVMDGTKTVRRMGLLMTDQHAVALGLGAAGNPNGAYTAWIVEYDSVNGVEGALFPGTTNAGNSITAASQKITYTIVGASFGNASADSYRIYRTIAGGAYPNGWLVTTQLKSVTSYTDNLDDTTLVTGTPYPIVTINDISESLNFDQQGVFQSIDTFQGSLVATPAVGNALYYSETGNLDAWPSSYSIQFFPLYGGAARCVRAQGDACYVFFDHETFMVNYLPKASDAVFDGGIAQKKIANYGTASANGACTISGFGTMQAILFASESGPMILMDGIADRAVSNIDWPNTVYIPKLNVCKFIDNPLKQRAELYFIDSATDNTSWSCLHFYYDSERITRKTAPLPELAWTGPHKVPGPGCYALSRVGTTNGNGIVFTGDKKNTGTIYQEDSGTSDAANLIDNSGTVQFRLRTKKLYPVGMDGEARADRLHIHKSADNTAVGNPDYTVTMTAYREEFGSVVAPTTINAENPGLSSVGVNNGFRSFDVRVVYDGTTAMPPINNITLRYKDAEEFTKTTR